MKIKTEERGLTLKECYSNLAKIRTIKLKLRYVFGFNSNEFNKIIKAIEKGENYTLNYIRELKK